MLPQRFESAPLPTAQEIRANIAKSLQDLETKLKEIAREIGTLTDELYQIGGLDHIATIIDAQHSHVSATKNAFRALKTSPLVIGNYRGE